MKSFWIVTKDIRLEDNNTLKNALFYSEEVYPCFISNMEQLSQGGPNSLHFLFESLEELNTKLKSFGSCLHIIDINNFENISKSMRITNAFILSGFTPFEKQRNQNYSKFLTLHEIDDALGMPRQFFLKSDGTPYRVFTPYSKHILSKGGLPYADLTIPQNITKCKLIKGFESFNFTSVLSSIKPKAVEANWKGGSNEGLSIMSDRYYNFQLFQMRKQYSEQQLLQSGYVKRERKDISPHVKFGTISPRLVYNTGLVDDDPNDKLKEHVEGRGILWRALYYNLFDQDLVILKNRNVVWYNDVAPKDHAKYYFELWCTGNTGYDFVDAGIHQLLRTGIMDNEVRMLTANFLVFGMGINWRLGEEFFRKHLVDYDWPLNVGNWAWSAQVGMDNPSPNKTYDNKPIRIFNPDTYKTKTKAEKDYRDNYIKRWLVRIPGSLPKQFDFQTNMRYNLQFY